MKNITKTILFASLIAALLIPFTGINAYAAEWTPLIYGDGIFFHDYVFDSDKGHNSIHMTVYGELEETENVGTVGFKDGFVFVQPRIPHHPIQMLKIDEDISSMEIFYIKDSPKGILNMTASNDVLEVNLYFEGKIGPYQYQDHLIVPNHKGIFDVIRGNVTQTNLESGESLTRQYFVENIVNFDVVDLFQIAGWK